MDKRSLSWRHKPLNLRSTSNQLTERGENTMFGFTVLTRIYNHEVTQQKGSNNSKKRGNRSILNTNKNTPPIRVSINNGIEIKRPSIKIKGLNTSTTSQNKILIANNNNKTPIKASITELSKNNYYLN